jgi:hypothetical protein
MLAAVDEGVRQLFEALEDMDKFYDLKDDPYEMKNVVGDPSLRATLEELKADEARLSGTGR